MGLGVHCLPGVYSELDSGYVSKDYSIISMAAMR